MTLVGRLSTPQDAADLDCHYAGGSTLPQGGGSTSLECLGEQLLEVLLLQVGTATAKAVARMWIKSDTGVDIAEGLIDKLGAHVPGLAERRRTARGFQDMADRVAAQLQPILDSEYGALPDYESAAAVQAVADVIDAAQEVDARELFAANLEPVALERLLRSRSEMRARRDLVPGAQLLFDRLLTEACDYVVELTLSLPQFSALALVEILKRETEISERVQAALDRIPQPAEIAENADQAFELTYRRHIARELDRLELFGLNLSENSSRYELSTAYITLSAFQDEGAGTPATSRKTSTTNGAADQGPAVDESEMRVDEVLAQSSRHLIKGEAGSGKTTLLQWLAITAARGSFPEELSEWSEHVPFMIRLRRYANKPLPNPENFLEQNASLISGIMPSGWVHRRLEAGNSILLIDGVDELPESQRAAVRDWLMQLVSLYPRCKYIVTTRPPAVPENWLSSAKFSLFELLPMSLPDINSFVEHWYDAAKSAVAHQPEQIATLSRYQSELTKVIRDNPVIRGLATAPLLCAMLCALNRDRRTRLPKDRMELYRIALESLLDRRDAEREIATDVGFSIGLREKEALLQHLAYWLILNEQADATRQQVIDRISERLRYMSLRAEPEAVFTHLLTRSGLIREPEEGRIDFIHKTFQEYLGAARAIADGNIPFLVQRADNDLWREVIILAAGHATQLQVDELLTGLLTRGDDDELLRHRLHLLAVACLETAVEISPDVKSAIQAALKKTLPPTNMTEARSVASAGSIASPLLANYSGRRATVVAACVRALCLIGGEESLVALRAYRADVRVTVIRELIRGWEYFDRGRYVDDILAHSPLHEGSLGVSDVESLAAVSRISSLSFLTFEGPRSLRSIDGLPGLEYVTRLDLYSCRQLKSLDGLDRCVKLEMLRLGYLSPIERLPDSLPQSLRDINISYTPDLVDLRSVASLPQLDSMVVMAPRVDYSLIEGGTASRLSVTAQRDRTTDWLKRWPNITILSLGSGLFTERGQSEAMPNLGAGNSCSNLENCAGLEYLNLSGEWQIETLRGMPRSLLHFDFVHAERLRDASDLSACQDLRSLTMNDATQLADFSFLENLSSLERLNIEGCRRFDDLDWISPTAPLEHLVIAKTSVTDLSALAQWPNLRHIDIESCEIEDFGVLESIDEDAFCGLVIDQEQAVRIPPSVLDRFDVTEVEKYTG